MSIKLWIKEIELISGRKLTISEDDIVVFVGPNNSGKTAILKEIHRLLVRDNYHNNKVVKELSVVKDGGDEQLSEFLKTVLKAKRMEHSAELIYQGYRLHPQPESSFLNTWQNEGFNYSSLIQFLTNILTTEDRLKITDPPENIDLINDPPTHPNHIVQKSDRVEQLINGYFKMAFGLDLILHRNAGRQVPFYVGTKPSLLEGEDRVSEEYIKRLEKLELLHQQGDGMKSFVGILLHTLLSNYLIHIIDEPEAFLHPPQAKLLGTMLGRELSKNKQFFFSTHSESFLKGLLDTCQTRLKIIRIERNGQSSSTHTLNSDDIQKVWGDPYLKQSNILAGLFYSMVVICEGDSDSTFYSAVLSAVTENRQTVAPDILFANSGGKQRLSVAINALKGLNVKTKVISDFDVLNAEYPLRGIFESLGGKWSTIKAEWSIVKKEIDQKGTALLTSDIKSQILSILNSVSSLHFPHDKAEQIETVLKRSSAWKEAKKIGASYIPRGSATAAFTKLKFELKKVGLLIPEVGEVEGFVRSVGNKSSRWLSDVLAKDLKNDDELNEARQFVEQLLE